ncbi:MAG: SDR family oxidoreductase [Planctomycetota bacterium]|jgi:short-subunit dehydrogenase
MAHPFQDHVVVVTGASRGIGRALALQLAEQQALLSLAARDTERLEAVADDCRRHGAQVMVVPTDVTDRERCQDLMEQTVSRLGPIDTLINNAGLSAVARFEDILDLSLAARLMTVNYLGSVYCTYYALPHLKATRGRIVGVSSLTGKTGVPLRSVYAASKHAMAGFFDSLRIEMRSYGISVTMAYPDFVQTEVRERALGPDGQPVGIEPAGQSAFMTAERCGYIILDAAAKRRREVVMSARGKVGMWLKLIAPNLIDRMATNAMRKVSYQPPTGSSAPAHRPPSTGACS